MIIVSFILPCFNTGKYLEQCVNSILNQRLSNEEYEIICVNNAATDNTANILSELSERFYQIKVVTLPINLCSGGAYNEGLKIAKGKYIQFVDSDDYLKDNVMASIIERMEADHLEMLYFNIDAFYDKEPISHTDNLEYNGNFVNPISCKKGTDFLREAIQTMDFNKIPVPAYRKLFLRSFLQDNNLYFTQTTIGCDYLHNMQCLLIANKVGAVTKRSYMFRFNPNGVTKSKQNSMKIIYALNNYASTLKYVDNLCSDIELRTIISNNLKILINAYIGAMKYLDRKGKMDVVNNVNDIQLLKEKSRGLINKLLIRYPGCFLSSHSLFLGLRKIL